MVGDRGRKSASDDGGRPGSCEASTLRRSELRGLSVQGVSEYESDSAAASMMVSANVGVEGRSGSLGGRPEMEMVRATLPDDDEGGGSGVFGPDDEMERRWWSRRK